MRGEPSHSLRQAETLHVKISYLDSLVGPVGWNRDCDELLRNMEDAFVTSVTHMRQPEGYLSRGLILQIFQRKRHRGWIRSTELNVRAVQAAREGTGGLPP